MLLGAAFQGCVIKDAAIIAVSPRLVAGCRDGTTGAASPRTRSSTFPKPNAPAMVPAIVGTAMTIPFAINPGIPAGGIKLCAYMPAARPLLKPNPPPAASGTDLAAL